MIRVGRSTYNKEGKICYPKYDGFTPIIVIMYSHSRYYPLSPYALKDENGHIMENIWQFSKIYKCIPQSTQYYSRYNKMEIWSHPKETHIDNDDNVLPAYWAWRQKGLTNPYAVRYPVGYKNRHTVAYSICDTKPNEKLNYVQARQEIYIPSYCNLVKKEPLFAELKQRLEKGENLLIIEPDGPHQESLGYYIENYNVEADFIDEDSVLMTDESLTILVHDLKHSFGHGYCLAMALLDKDETLVKMWLEDS